MNGFVDAMGIGCWAAGIGIVWGRYSSFGWIEFVFSTGIIGAGKFDGIFGLEVGCLHLGKIHNDSWTITVA